MSSTKFITDENIGMIWEVISDEDIFKNNNNKSVFIEEIHNFYEREKYNYTDLLSMNKFFINEIIEVLNKKIKNKKSVNNLSNISNQTNNLITYNEIQTNNINIFEREFEKKKKDFNNLISVNIPEKPKFNIEIEDKPIGEMEELIRKTVEQRNFEIEKIQEINNLKNQETSIKVETEKVKNNIFSKLKILNKEQENNIKEEKEKEKEEKEQKEKEKEEKEEKEKEKEEKEKEERKEKEEKEKEEKEKNEDKIISYLNNRFDEINSRIDEIYKLISKNSL
jgi:hypothetical protein